MIDCLRERQKDESLAEGLLRIKTDISLTLFFLSRYGRMTLISTNLARNSIASKTLASLVGEWWLVVLAVLSFRCPEKAGPRPNPSSCGVPRKDSGGSHSWTRPTRDSWQDPLRQACDLIAKY